MKKYNNNKNNNNILLLLSIGLFALQQQQQQQQYYFCCNAFVVPSRNNNNNHKHHRSIVVLDAEPTIKRNEENRLRQVIQDKNTVIEKEEDYGVADVLDEETTTSFDDEKKKDPTTNNNKATSEKAMKRLLKERPYPLFLAEKVAQVLDGMVESVAGQSNSNNNNNNKVDEYTAVARNKDTTSSTSTKERIVVLGTGWGAAAFLSDIDASKYDVTVVSPRNYFLFTPMLAGSSVGTVEFRSITEPVRQINSEVEYIEATASSIDPIQKTVECESVVCEGNSCEIQDFVVEYDKLLVAVGAQTNTFGIPGVREHCCFLKSVQDARQIRTAIVHCFERANLPRLSDEERTSILTFCVIGAGPTGVEFASELRDFVEQDGQKYYPALLKHVRIKVIEASSKILAPFDQYLQEEAIRQLNKKTTFFVSDPDRTPERYQLTELLLESGVSEVKENVICLQDGTNIPYGLAVWAAGIGPLPITLDLLEALKTLPNNDGDDNDDAKTQASFNTRGRLAIDPWLRVVGAEGSIFALGDCACFPDSPLPATAQVASQQGEFLAKLLSRQYDVSAQNGPLCPDGFASPPKRQKKAPDALDESLSLEEKVSSIATGTDEYAAPFQFLNLGILAYTGGGSALAQLQVTPSDKTRVKGTGKVGFGLWRSVYLSKQVSWRNRVLVFVDWAKTQAFGRDITQL